MSNRDPIHPGEQLAEMLDELGISQHRPAKRADSSGSPAGNDQPQQIGRDFG